MVVQCGAPTTWRHHGVILKYYCCACAPVQYSSPTLHYAHQHRNENNKITKYDGWNQSLAVAIITMLLLWYYYPINSTINLCWYIRSSWRTLCGGTGDGGCVKCLCCYRNDSGSMRWSAGWILHQRVASFQSHLSGGDAPFSSQDSRSIQASHENFSFWQPQKSRQIQWTHFYGFSLVLWGW